MSGILFCKEKRKKEHTLFIGFSCFVLAMPCFTTQLDWCYAGSRVLRWAVQYSPYIRNSVPSSSFYNIDMTHSAEIPPCLFLFLFFLSLPRMRRAVFSGLLS